MGWASGGEIFDEMAHVLQHTSIGSDRLVAALYRLATTLQDNDWDTVDESIARFAGAPDVVLALRMAQGTVVLYSENEQFDATVEYLPGPGGALLGPSASFVLRQHGFPDESRQASRPSWNELVGIWLHREGGPVDPEYVRRLTI